MVRTFIMHFEKAVSKRTLRQAGCSLGILLLCTAPALARKKAPVGKSQLTPEMLRLIDQSSVQ